MIKIEETAKMHNMTVEELKVYFKKYPGSGKKIIVQCDRCPKIRIIEYKKYDKTCDICHACSMIKRFEDDPDLGARQGATLRQTHLDDPTIAQKQVIKVMDYWNKPGSREEAAQNKIDYYNGNDVAKEKARQVAIEQWSDQKACDIQSETIKNSVKCKENIENQRGGNDIVKHHYIYDHNDLTKYTMEMTRSDHTRIHWLMWKSNIKVPHINIKEDK